MKIALTVNGLTIDAFFTDEEVEQVHLPLLRLLAQKQQQKGARLVVFLAAPPGSGKSTLTAFWQHLSAQCDELPALQTLPMDGFHRPNSWLDAQGLRSKKECQKPLTVSSSSWRWLHSINHVHSGLTTIACCTIRYPTLLR